MEIYLKSTTLKNRKYILFFGNSAPLLGSSVHSVAVDPLRLPPYQKVAQGAQLDSQSSPSKNAIALEMDTAS